MRALTGDVFLAAYLIVADGGGGSLVDLIVDGDGQRQSVTFVLEAPNAIALQEEYSRGEAMASVKAIRDTVSRLRGELARALRRTPSGPWTSSFTRR